MPPRQLPRFLPTLTEVVPANAVNPSPASVTANLDETVQAVMQQVIVVLERRLGEQADAIARTLVTAQMQAMGSTLHEELATIVRQALLEVTNARSDAHKSKY